MKSKANGDADKHEHLRMGGSSFAPPAGYAALVTKLQTEIEELDISIGSAIDGREWRRLHRLEGSKDTLLGLLEWVNRHSTKASDRRPNEQELHAMCLPRQNGT